MSKNKYARNSRMSEDEFKQLVNLFALDMDAASIAEALGFSRNTVNAYLHRIRHRIAEHSMRFSLELQTLGERFFVLRQAGRRHDPAGPMVIYGAIQRNRTIYVDVHAERLREALDTIISGRMYVEGTLDPMTGERFSTYLDLDFGEEGVFEPKQGFIVQRHSPAEELLRFLLFTRGRIHRLRGIRAEVFPLHLKETEFRFNFSEVSIYPLLMRLFTERRLE